MAYLKLNNLTKKYQKKILAVDKLNLDIEKGEFLVLLGPSGCGKTTIMRMIAGLEEVTDGDIMLEGKSIKDLRPKDRGVSMIFQSYAVWPHMTVYDNIAYALKLRKLPKDEIEKKVHKAAEMSNIVDYLKRYPAQLSGGQRQRVAVARAMAVEPKLFLMDEPLSNLDAKLRVAMRTDLKEVHKQLGSTTIFVTHDQSEALSLADRIVVMNMGVVEQIGTPNEIYHDSETMFVANFIGSPPTNFIDVKIQELNGDIYAVNEAFKFFVKEEVKNSLKKYIGKEVVLGVRPENFVIAKEGLFNIKVSVVEPQGSHTIIVSKLLDKQLKIVSNDKFDINIDDELSIDIGKKYIFFDKETEKRIR